MDGIDIPGSILLKGGLNKGVLELSVDLTRRLYIHYLISPIGKDRRTPLFSWNATAAPQQPCHSMVLLHYENFFPQLSHNNRALDVSYVE